MSKSPRVLFLDHVAEIGGAELSLLDLARRLQGRAEVLLFADGPFRERLETAGVPVQVVAAGGDVLAVRRHSGLRSLLHVGPQVVQLARGIARQASRFDVVYANSQKAFVLGALAARLARRPLIWHLRDMLTAAHFSRALRSVAVKVVEVGGAHVIANSEATAKAFIAAGGRQSRIRVIYNGIDSAPFDAAPVTSGVALRRELGCTGAPLVGVFSRLAAWKGQHVLIEALGRLPSVHAILVGSALFGEDAYEAGLRRQTQRAGLADRVHFLGFRDDAPDLMRAVDVVAHTSVAPEPFGRVIVEGMLARRPVVASAAGGALEIIQDGVTGMLVPPGDAAALARAIEDLLAAPALANKLAMNGRAEASARFSLDASVSAVEDLLHSVTRSESR